MSPEIVSTFRALLEEAREAGEREPTAMILATSGADGRISARAVLLKAFDEHGFVFYTNTLSDKGRQLAAHPRAALCFLWTRVRDHVQVRIEGRVECVAEAEADAYFATRARDSQIGAWASPQSETLEDRASFERRIAEREAEFAGREVPRPPCWSGYRVLPDRIEFWYGARFRLHDRHLHEWRDGAWHERLLYP